MQALLVSIVIGAVAGWLAGLIVLGRGAGLLANVVVGLVGGTLAGGVLPTFGINVGGVVMGAIVNATFGAVLLLVVLNLIRR